MYVVVNDKDKVVGLVEHDYAMKSVEEFISLISGVHVRDISRDAGYNCDYIYYASNSGITHKYIVTDFPVWRING